MNFTLIAYRENTEWTDSCGYNRGTSGFFETFFTTDRALFTAKWAELEDQELDELHTLIDGKPTDSADMTEAEDKMYFELVDEKDASKKELQKKREAERIAAVEAARLRKEIVDAIAIADQRKRDLDQLAALKARLGIE